MKIILKSAVTETENQIRIIRSIYDKKDNFLEWLIGKDVLRLKLILEMVNDSENLYFEGKYGSRLNVWRNVEKIIYNLEKLAQADFI